MVSYLANDDVFADFYPRSACFVRVLVGNGCLQTTGSLSRAKCNGKLLLPNTRIIILEKFTQKMADSSYAPSTRKEILLAGIRKYYRLGKEEIEGTSLIQRSTEGMKESRRYKPLINKK